MFQGLADKLEAILSSLKNKGRLTEKDIDATLREVKVALLEADVNFKVVKDFTAQVREKALGHGVLDGLNPSQQVVSVVHGELTSLLGGNRAEIARSPLPPTRIMLVGTQGSGKTTTAAKLAVRMRKEGMHPFLIPADMARPAAIAQLLTLAERAGVPAYRPAEGETPLAAWRNGSLEGARQGADLLILDTAGRLHVDEELLREAEVLAADAQPHEILLVADAMTGQDAVRVAEAFGARLRLTGVVLTKTDGDARGGAALSLRRVTGVPVKFAGTGEGLEALEPFHPERAASRILGMGDVLTLIDRAREAVAGREQEEAEAAARALGGEFDLTTFAEQMRKVRKLGSLGELMKMLPLPGKMKAALPEELDDREMTRTLAIIDSMTPLERARPSVFNGSRRKRVADGSGTTVQEVNRLLKQFDAARLMMKQAGRMAKKKGGRSPFPFPQ